MKSTIRKSTFKAIYRLLDRVSPVPYDCGKLCGCACCVPQRTDDVSAIDSEDLYAVNNDNYEDGGDLGIYLLPGEEKLFTGSEDWITWNYDNADDYEFPTSWSGRIAFLSCNTPPFCDRKMRPLQCRTYPVTPHLLKSESDIGALFGSVDEDGDGCGHGHGYDPEPVKTPSCGNEMLILILSDMEAPYTCPLIKENSNSNPESREEKMILDERFLKATYTVWKRLIKDPKIHDLVKMDSENREFFVPVYPHRIISHPLTDPAAETHFCRASTS